MSPDVKIRSDKRLYLIGGPGGVGKTTLAASIGLNLAAQGFKTVVLTVDPAKRLAEVERDTLVATLAYTQGNRQYAADLLGITVTILTEKLTAAGLTA